MLLVKYSFCTDNFKETFILLYLKSYYYYYYSVIGDYLETKIRQFRQDKGITQQELADLVGVTRQTINALENARYNPSLLLAYKITKILGKNIIEDVFIMNDD